MKLRSLAIGLTVLTSGVVIGTATQQFASADISSGDRPVLVPIETCRIADTRPAPNAIGPQTTALGEASSMTIDAQQSGTDCTGKIPAGAIALSLNITALDATSNSFLTVWAGGPRPATSAMNPAPGMRVFNAVTTQLSQTQTFDIFNNRGTVNVFVDVNGYYENHDHDDRYYTEAEVDAAIEAATPSKDWIAVNPAAFTARNPDTTTYEIGSGGQLRIEGGSMHAPVDLPHGATIDGLSASLWDDAPEAINVELIRSNNVAPFFDPVFEVESTTDAPGAMVYSDATPSEPEEAVVDNTMYSYALVISGGNWAANRYDMRFQHAVVEVTLP
ncbi:MAG: hypothetical protein AB8G14_08750 [Ilumatobacter sp.]